jgi:hypothetical protein
MVLHLFGCLQSGHGDDDCHSEGRERPIAQSSHLAHYRAVDLGNEEDVIGGIFRSDFEQRPRLFGTVNSRQGRNRALATIRAKLA